MINFDATAAMSTVQALTSVIEKKQGSEASHRSGLAAAAAAGSIDSLTGIVNDLAEVQGYIAVYSCAAEILIHEADNEATAAKSMQEVLSSVFMYTAMQFNDNRDRWSGRGNDNRRAYLDGVQKAMSDLPWALNLR